MSQLGETVLALHRAIDARDARITALEAAARTLWAEVKALRWYSKFVPAELEDEVRHERMADMRTGARAAMAATDADPVVREIREGR